ncbi:MAG: ISNCY family transposase [Chloroflexi bacterium]|nr:ISNCY family transposase [Chloroflexota bacterium]
MSQRERDRLKVVHELVTGRQLTQAQAGELLRLSGRQVRRLVKRYREAGDGGLIHRGRGRPSNRRTPAETRQRVVKQLRETYAGFGPTLAAEKLAERDGLVVSRETVRRWMIAEELHAPRRRRVEARKWRERRPCYGELVQMDTSIHDWFEGRGETAVLISMIDDATGHLWMRFYPTDSTATNMAHLREYVVRYGRPVALYADKASHFKTTRSASREEQLQGREAQTQIERALRELQIEYIPAHSPQAKGRVERCFGTAQDRLVKELRLAGIRTLEAANAFLEETYLPLVNERFTVEPACSVAAHRSADGFDLDAIFSVQESRTVANDYTIRFRNTRYQITQRPLPAGLRRATVVVQQRLDATLRLRYRGRYLSFERVGPIRRSGSAAPASVGLRPPSAGAADTQRPAPPKPKPNHPWKRGYDRTLLLRRQQDTSNVP